MASNLKQYPTGFLGNSNVDQAIPNPDRNANKMINQILNKVDIVGESSLHTYSTEADRIWAVLMSNSEESRTFEFRESVLDYAVDAFGTTYFSEWFSSQSQNPEFSAMHQAFIDDTISYVFYGTRRQYTVNNWLSFLDDSKKNNVVEKYSPIQAKFLLEQNPFREDGIQCASLTITNFINLWVNREGGIDDLAFCLFILFGDR